MTITKNVLKFYDISLDKRMQFGTISQQPTANSQQPTANSQQPTANSQQINFNQNNILFSDSAFLLRAVSEFILAIRRCFVPKHFVRLHCEFTDGCSFFMPIAR